MNSILSHSYLIIVPPFSMHTCIAEFIETPLPLNVTSEQQATFRCSHGTADAIVWRVNNISVRNLPNSVVHTAQSVSNGILISYLYFEPHLEFNETQWDCIALFFDAVTPTEISPKVTLRIQGTLLQ